MPCESLESIAITPRSCSSPSAAIVCARTRWRTIVESPCTRPGASDVDGRHHREVLGLGVHAERHGRRRRGGEDALAAGQRERVGPVAAAAALDVEGVPGAARRDGDRVLDREQLVHAVGVDGQLHVVGIGDVERAAQLLGAGADVLVDLEAAAARAQRRLDRARARRGARTSRQALSGWASSAAQVARSPSSGLQPRFQPGRSPGSRASSARPRARRRRSAARASARAGRCRRASPRGRARRSRPWRCRARRRWRPSCRGCRRDRRRRRAHPRCRCWFAARRAPDPAAGRR